VDAVETAIEGAVDEEEDEAPLTPSAKA